jgi:hypothetical protein
MFIPDFDFYPSRIPDLGSLIPDPTTALEEGEIFLALPFFVAKKISLNCKQFHF